MKNNEWNVPSDYFEKNKKALMPVRKMTNRNWLLALAAACFVGIGLFMWKGGAETNEVAKVQEIGEDKNGEEKVREGKIEEHIGSKYLSTKEDIGAKYLSTKEEIAEELKEIPREELVAYLLEEDSELIENLN